MNLELAGRVAVVTGGTSGIGLATVQRFLEEGASVAFCARSRTSVDAVAAECAATYGDRVIGVAADILDADAMAAFSAAVAARFGGADVLVNNAVRVWAGSTRWTMPPGPRSWN
jgi:NAD(P)-dependent dehydrogenase (short-subunit alcohol dehydrogenase family)